MARKLNERAHELNRRFFELCYELGQLDLVAMRSLDFDAASELTAAVDAAKAAQAQLSACDLVIDASRDAKDQSYTATGGQKKVV